MAEHRSDDEASSATILIRPNARMRQPSADIARYIAIVDGSERGKKLELGLRPVTIGRHRDNQLVIGDPFVSTHHCSISFDAGSVWITDLGSTNGSFLDGSRVVGRVVWPDGVSLQIGNQVLRHEYRARDEIKRSTELAEDLQHASDYVRSLLPAPLSSGPIRTDWHAAPSAELGGDFFGYHWLSDDLFAFYLLDVCGHGIGAALHSVSVANLLRQQFLPGVDFGKPSEVLTALNKALPMERYGSMYFTLWYGVLRTTDRQLTYASAGHPPGLLFRGPRRLREALATPNPPIGIVEQSVFQDASTRLEPGSSLILYSDGVFEIALDGGRWWTPAELADFLQGSGLPPAARIFENIRALTKAGRFDDDFSLLRLDFE